MTNVRQRSVFSQSKRIARGWLPSDPLWYKCFSLTINVPQIITETLTKSRFIHIQDQLQRSLLFCDGSAQLGKCFPITTTNDESLKEFHVLLKESSIDVKDGLDKNLTGIQLESRIAASAEIFKKKVMDLLNCHNPKVFNGWNTDLTMRLAWRFGIPDAEFLSLVGQGLPIGIDRDIPSSAGLYRDFTYKTRKGDPGEFTFCEKRSNTNADTDNIIQAIIKDEISKGWWDIMPVTASGF